MFDPTHFENLKVAFENRIYDLDNTDQKIVVTNRADRIDMAVLSRDLAIQFQLAGQPGVKAEVVLEASIQDLAGEILEISSAKPGCSLSLIFYKQVQDIAAQCMEIERAIYAIWENDVELTQTLSLTYGQETSDFLNKIKVAFKTKLSEENMREIVPFLNHVLKTMEILNNI